MGSLDPDDADIPDLGAGSLVADTLVEDGPDIEDSG